MQNNTGDYKTVDCAWGFCTKTQWKLRKNYSQFKQNPHLAETVVTWPCCRTARGMFINNRPTSYIIVSFDCVVSSYITSYTPCRKPILTKPALCVLYSAITTARAQLALACCNARYHYISLCREIWRNLRRSSTKTLESGHLKNPVLTSI